MIYDRKNIIIAGIAVILIVLFLATYQRSGQRFLAGGTFAADTAGLPDATPSETVELKDGDTYNLTASIVKKTIGGSQVKMLAYNGSIPGPTIKVQQGSRVTIHLKNDTDVETALHSHGIRAENKFDGAVPLNQKAIPVGGTFAYTLDFPDAGTFWYHPHVREDYAQELGLYGSFLVVPNDPGYWQAVSQEVPLTLDDILMSQGKIYPFDRLEVDHALMGRFGNTMLVNGETDYSLSVKQGDVIRFSLINTANTRTFNVAIPRAKMKLVGGDNGKYEKEQFVDSVVISPSERAIVEVLFDAAGTYQLQHVTPERTYPLGTVIVNAEKSNPSYAKEFSLLRTNQDVIDSIAPFRVSLVKQADREVALTVDMMGMSAGQSGMGGMDHSGHSGQMMGGSEGPIEWEDDMAMMNGSSTADMVAWNILDTDTYKKNMDVDWKFNVGDHVKIKIFNDPNSAHPMQHPIHFHGQRFLVASRNGAMNDNLVWKDTVLVGKGETVEILLDASNPGDWMAHCHIAEHLESGMMIQFQVEERR